MCGIFGHTGKGDSLKKTLLGLKFLEYRGYDSTGIAGIYNEEIFCYKASGKLANLEEKLNAKKVHFFATTIGHTRWATHGIPNTQNAHPHTDQMKSLAIVHNGIIENHHQIRLMLKEKGITFQSETDTEVVAALIAFLYQGDIFYAIQKAISFMSGFWALAVIHKKHPDQILVTKRENPLVIGHSKKTEEAYISSDPHAFQEKDLDVYFLKNNEIGIVTSKNISIYDQNAKIIFTPPQKIQFSEFLANKGEFSHFMLKEIFEQPRAILSSIHDRFLFEKADAEFEDFYPKPNEFSKILLLGCGSSWHAGCIAAMQFEAIAGIPAQAEIASEFRYKLAPIDPKTLVIAISQSGETFDTIAAVKKAKKQGAKILVICNTFGSTLTQEADYVIYLRAGPEISVCSTKAFNCQLALLALLVLKMGRLHSLTFEEGQSFLREIISLPQKAEEILEQEEICIHLAQKYAPLENFFFIGRQYMFPTSLEASLKLKEISYLNSFAYPAGELKHGPLALIDPRCLVIGLCGNTLTYEKMLSNLLEVKAREGKILAFAFKNSPEIADIADDVLWLPSLSDPLAPIGYCIAVQLLAYYIAKERGREIDMPRNLAKSVTVE